jgi:hypothetical protein
LRDEEDHLQSHHWKFLRRIQLMGVLLQGPYQVSLKDRAEGELDAMWAVFILPYSDLLFAKGHQRFLSLSY